MTPRTSTHRERAVDHAFQLGPWVILLIILPLTVDFACAPSPNRHWITHVSLVDAVRLAHGTSNHRHNSRCFARPGWDPIFGYGFFVPRTSPCTTVLYMFESQFAGLVWRLWNISELYTPTPQRLLQLKIIATTVVTNNVEITLQ